LILWKLAHVQLSQDVVYSLPSCGYSPACLRLDRPHWRHMLGRFLPLHRIAGPADMRVDGVPTGPPAHADLRDDAVGRRLRRQPALLRPKA